MTKLDRADFDGVLLDYLMPGITGLTVLPHISGSAVPRYPW